MITVFTSTKKNWQSNVSHWWKNDVHLFFIESIHVNIASQVLEASIDRIVAACSTAQLIDTTVPGHVSTVQTGYSVACLTHGGMPGGGVGGTKRARYGSNKWSYFIVVTSQTGPKERWQKLAYKVGSVWERQSLAHAGGVCSFTQEGSTKVRMDR